MSTVSKVEYRGKLIVRLRCENVESLGVRLENYFLHKDDFEEFNSSLTPNDRLTVASKLGLILFGIIKIQQLSLNFANL